MIAQNDGIFLINIIYFRINNSNDPVLLQKTYKEIERQAASHCKQMFAEYNFKLIKGFGWFLHKVFKQIYEKVIFKLEFYLYLKFFFSKFI